MRLNLSWSLYSPDQSSAIRCRYICWSCTTTSCSIFSPRLDIHKRYLKTYFFNLHCNFIWHQVIYTSNLLIILDGGMLSCGRKESLIQAFYRIHYFGNLRLGCRSCTVTILIGTHWDGSFRSDWILSCHIKNHRTLPYAQVYSKWAWSLKWRGLWENFQFLSKTANLWQQFFYRSSSVTNCIIKTAKDIIHPIYRYLFKMTLSQWFGGLLPSSGQYS